MTNLEAINHLFISGVINYSTRTQLTKRAERLEAKALKAQRQAEVDAVVRSNVEAREGGFKHRSVWEAVGRNEFTRDEVLKSLQNLRTEGIVEQVRTGPNNFQVHWVTTAGTAITVSEGGDTEAQ
jgi:hypothetical protein